MMRTKAGDDNAFSQLVMGYQDRLLGIFYHMLRDQGAAEDLVQEVFLRIYRARNGYQPTAKFSTWLFRIANNVASNARRTIGRRKEISLNTQQESGSVPVGAHKAVMSDRSSLLPTRQVVKRETCQIVQTAVDTLNERQRMAVLLHKFEGMSYEDIARPWSFRPRRSSRSWRGPARNCAASWNSIFDRRDAALSREGPRKAESWKKSRD